MVNKFSERTASRLRQLGEKLRRMRLTLGVSRTVLAGRLRMHPMNYARIEQGKQNVTFETLLRVADALGVELDVRLKRAKKVEKKS